MRAIVALSPQFDLCYALAELLAPDPRIAAETFGIGARAPAWLTAARPFGWSFWLAVPDALEDRAPARTVAEFIDAIAALEPATLFGRIHRGLFHSAPGDRQPSEKREWLHFVGLDDNETANLVPERLGAPIVVDILRGFGARFDPVWDRLLPALSRSAEETESLARSARFPEIARTLDLAMEGGEPRGRLRAVRGGWSIATSDVDTVYLVPSAFNPRRLCHAADERLPVTLFFPYQAVDSAGAEVAAAPIDPWLVSRALGDPTRAAIVRRLAANPRTASDLLAELGLSKATISHHIFQLREAGLIEEKRSGKSILLSLRRDPLDGLSAAFKRNLRSRS